MKVSIVTISFNQAAYLERTIRSVLCQSYPDVEYILVDPGSTDGSLNIIEKYHRQISTTILEPDNGAADGLNKGFAASTGDVLGFLNSDDILYPEAVANAVRFMTAHPEIDVVSGNAKVIGPDDRELRRAYSDRMELKRYVYGGVVLIQPSTFFRRDIYVRAGGFNGANRATWDGELFFEMARCGARFSLCGDIWSGYRLHNQSITSSKKMAEVADSSHREMFRRVMGRSPNRFDTILSAGARLWRHALNPRDTYERIMHGPVYGRAID